MDAIKLPRGLYESIIDRFAETLFTQYTRGKWNLRFFIESETCHYILADIEMETAKGVIRAYFVPDGAIIL